MDALTHFALGICTTEIFRKKDLGKGFLFWGASAQCLPDLDTAAALYLPADRVLQIHRGFTHSLLFALLAGLCLAWVTFRIYRRKEVSFLLLFGFFCAQLILHDLLDVCNSYGTGLLEPFSHHRFSVNLLYVADPLFSIGFVLAAIVLLVKSNDYLSRPKWAWTAILFSAFYLGYAAINKVVIDNRVSAAIKARGLHYKGYFTTPAPMNSMLWYAVINTDSCYYTGYVSVFDSRSPKVKLEQHPKNYFLLSAVRGKHSVQNLKNFANGCYTISGSINEPYINILRFGQIQGWKRDNAPFVLSLPLMIKGNVTALQKGRLAEWNMDNVKLYLKRIAGNQ